MNLELTNKKALVTGASSGIGAAVCRILAEEGADVALVYRQNKAGAVNTARVIETLGRQAWLTPIDLTDLESIREGVQQIGEAAGKLDLLILCAGYNRISNVDEITPSEWDLVLSTNLSGVFYLVQAIHPILRKGASIVTVASVAAHTGAPHHAHYAAAKAGLVNLTKSLARAYGPEIRVNCVAPGVTITAMGQDTLDALAPDYAQKKLLVGRYASAEEIAKCIVFAASPIAGFMTGATLDINGGRTLR